MGQGKKYTPEEREQITADICERLLNGESLRQICMDEHMPNASTVFRWWNDDEALAATITRARSHQADALYADMDSYVARMLEGEIDHNTARVAIWARQWQAARMNPRRYGDRIEAKLSGDITVTVDRVED